MFSRRKKGSVFAAAYEPGTAPVIPVVTTKLDTMDRPAGYIDRETREARKGLSSIFLSCAAAAEVLAGVPVITALSQAAGSIAGVITAKPATYKNIARRALVAGGIAALLGHGAGWLVEKYADALHVGGAGYSGLCKKDTKGKDPVSGEEITISELGTCDELRADTPERSQDSIKPIY